MTEFDELSSSSSTSSILKVDDLYAKPDKKLIDHLTETGMIAEQLLLHGRGTEAVNILSQQFPLSRDEIVSSISFLCAEHDIGKAHPGFQKEILEKSESGKEKLQILTDKGLITEKDENIRHERYTREIMVDYLKSIGFDPYEAKCFAYIPAYHHQGKTEHITEPVLCVDKTDKRWLYWKNVQAELLDTLSRRWPFSPKFKNITETMGINGAVYFILSTIVTSDWIASGSIWDDFLKKYHSISLAASQFIKENELLHESMSSSFKDLKWEDVFKFKKNKLQELLSGISMEDVSLLLLEYPCGYGKTESGLLAASKCPDKGGIYLATPTTSTAKGLMERIQALAINAGLGCNIPELDGSMMWSDDKMSKIPKELWTSRKRHQFLYPYAVGTVDQVIKNILSYRYSCIGMMGLTDKVVIIDEVHAYDTFMLSELQTLLQWNRFFKVPTILLSATLPTKTKKKLFAAAGMGKDQTIESAYPLVSIIRNKKLEQYTTPCDGREFPVNITKTNDVMKYMYKKAMAHKKGCLAIIVPTVDDAFELFDMVSAGKKDGEVVLFVGRDTVIQKAGKIKKLETLLGKNREKRPQSLIVISTSIIEQSLDIDFDKMITTLAPIDLLIQRLGRVWRHPDEETIREKFKIPDPYTIVIPEEYGSLSRIYYEGILKKTEEVISGIKKINTVTDVRKLIDDVYNDVENPNDGNSEMKAGRHCLDNPFRDENTLVDDSNETYLTYASTVPKTREESYPTIQIAVLKKIPTDCTYKEAREIMQGNVVNVPKYKIEHFTPCEKRIEWLPDVEIYIGDKDLTVVGVKGHRMQLTKDGLRFW